VNGWRRQFLARGVIWRQALRLAVLNTPIWIEPFVIGFSSLFFLLWGPGRRGVMHNLRAIKPGSWPVVNFFRTYRVFWNFAWSITDTGRFRETGTMPDWEFGGMEHYTTLSTHEGGAVILTAHMGSYDLGAHVFSATSHRKLVMVRAPEVDPQTQAFEESLNETSRSEALRIDFNTKASELALELLHAIQHGELVAIQGDRATPGISTIATTLFGKPARIPAGPFALAMAARVPVFPLFILRTGRRRYRLVTCAPIHVERVSRQRDDDLRAAAEQWAKQLEEIIARGWYQWFAFEPYEGEAAA
jgi:predicted LPLAT superfamily acyltransferase